MSRIPMTGVYPNITNEEYHANKDYISRSALMDFEKSPYTYWAKHINPDRPIRESTPAMILGSSFHTLILEPDLWGDIYTVMPRKVLLRDVGREEYDANEHRIEATRQNLSKKIIITHDCYDTLIEMEKKVLSNKQAMQLLENARIENSFFWQDEHSGLNLKCRPDVLHDNMIIDLKTTSNASPRAFQREMVDYGYHIQFAMIRDAIEIVEGRRINNCINIVIETKYPYNMAIYIIDGFALDEGEFKYRQICLDLKNAIEENKWQDYGIQTISLPKWAT
jgi:PDDEXK-like domain of unknown function (DUF3799)